MRRYIGRRPKATPDTTIPEGALWRNAPVIPEPADDPSVPNGLMPRAPKGRSRPRGLLIRAARAALGLAGSWVERHPNATIALAVVVLALLGWAIPGDWLHGAPDEPTCEELVDANVYPPGTCR